MNVSKANRNILSNDKRENIQYYNNSLNEVTTLFAVDFIFISSDFLEECCQKTYLNFERQN